MKAQSVKAVLDAMPNTRRRSEEVTADRIEKHLQDFEANDDREGGPEVRGPERETLRQAMRILREVGAGDRG